MSRSTYLDPEGLARAKQIANRHGLTMGDIRSPLRAKAYARCRHEIAHTLADETRMSLPAIGAIINRDHTTVMVSIWRENARLGVNVRGMGTNEPRREKNRIRAYIAAALSREVLA